jgi:lysozyme family protein
MATCTVGAMAKFDALVDSIIATEGGFSNNPLDAGGATKFGITARTLGQWRKLGRNATQDEVRAMPLEEARAIYTERYILNPGFDKIEYEALRAQLVDFGVNSGQALAIQKLQTVLKVDADGVLGPKTLAALETADLRAVNNALVAERVRMIGRIVVKAKTQVVFLNGWLNRALSFLR